MPVAVTPSIIGEPRFTEVACGCTVIAGGVTRAGEALFGPLRAEVRRRAFSPAVKAARIVPAELPGTAGVVGAVATFKTETDGAL